MKELKTKSVLSPQGELKVVFEFNEEHTKGHVEYIECNGSNDALLMALFLLKDISQRTGKDISEICMMLEEMEALINNQ